MGHLYMRDTHNQDRTDVRTGMGRSVKIIMHLFITAAVVLATAAVSDAGNNTVSVTATVLSKSNCHFITSASSLNFGSLDPASSSNVISSTTITFRCGGSAPNATFAINHDNGLYETGPGANRMQHSTVVTEYLPYTLTLSPLSNTVPKNVNQTLSISGSVKATDFQQAYVGSYADTVVISIAP